MYSSPSPITFFNSFTIRLIFFLSLPVRLFLIRIDFHVNFLFDINCTSYYQSSTDSYIFMSRWFFLRIKHKCRRMNEANRTVGINHDMANNKICWSEFPVVSHNAGTLELNHSHLPPDNCMISTNQRHRNLIPDTE